MSPNRPHRNGLRRLLSFPNLSVKGVRAASPSEGELLFELTGGNPENRLFGRFDGDWVLERLGAAGFLSALARRGFPRPLLAMDCGNPQDQRIFLYADEPRRERLLFETRLEIRSFHPSKPLGPFTRDDVFRMLVIHWLVLSDPDRGFDFRRPRLPGQQRPGLGLLGESLSLLSSIGRELLIDGVLDVPDHYHTALFYSRLMRFFDPRVEGRFQAMARDLAGVPLALASEAIREGALVDAATGEPVEWRAEEQILPTHGPLRRYFRSRAYEREREEAAQGLRVAVDWDLYRRKIALAASPGKYS